MIPASVLPQAHLLRAFKPSSVSTQWLLTILTMSCTCGTSTVFFRVPQARLDCCCRQRRSDRLFLRGSDVSEVRLVLASHVLHSGMRDLVLQCLAAKLMIWTLFAVEASGCFCREFILALDLPCSHPLWVRSFHPLWVRSFHFFSHWCSSKLLGLLVVFDCLSRRARRSRWRTVRLLRVVLWTSTTVHVTLLLKAASSLSGLLSDLTAQLLWFASTSFLAQANGLSMTSIVLRVLCFGVRDVSHRSFLLRPSPRWPCTSRHRHARFG